MDFVIEVVGGVLTRADGAVLACRRAPGQSAGGLWEFPGGKVEPGELPETALARELWEELAIDVTVGERIDRSLTAVEGTGIDLATYRIIWSSDAPISSYDHDELRWLSLAELDTVEWAEPDAPTVRALKRAI
ncbi:MULTISPECIES: NUDIX domain-containing protein [Curtobacterium]|uniref:(deoxy)nucleoside triphosphate pyrophosphohydrolase n=1 Tax=Curtobacterium flaccumfaciens TaxID=2035 RepID=UPI003EE4973F